jgi:AraC family transcriptional regulator
MNSPQSPKAARTTEYGEFYKRSAYGAFPQEHRHSVGQFSFSMIMVEQGAHTFVDPNVPDTVLCLLLRDSAPCTWSWNMGAGWRRELALAGRMLVVPANVDSRWEVSGPRRLLLLVIPAITLREALGPALRCEPSEAFQLLAEASWEDAFTETMMLRLWEAAAGQHATDHILADYVIVGTLTHLLQRAGTSQGETRVVALPRWRLRRVTEYANRHLHEHLDLKTLADAAGLSHRHFSRVFLKETGQTPHRWLMMLRLERAKALLVESDLRIIQIAECCGFASQTHLTRALNSHVGITPLRWRNEHKSRSGCPLGETHRISRSTEQPATT